MRYWKTYWIFAFFVILLANQAFASEASKARQLQKLQAQQEVDTRFADYFKKLQQNPKDPQAHLALGQAYLDQQMLELAQESFRRALALDKNLAQAHVGLSKVYRKKKLKQLEVLELETAVVKAPQNDTFRYQLGVVYMEPKTYDYKKAKKQYKALQKMQSPLAAKLAPLVVVE